MEISSSTLPAVAAERATMFVALELSKSSWLVALHSPIADKVSLHRFVGGDVTGLLALIARKQTQAEARLGRGAGRTEGTDRLCLVAARPHPARVARCRPPVGVDHRSRVPGSRRRGGLGDNAARYRRDEPLSC